MRRASRKPEPIRRGNASAADRVLLSRSATKFLTAKSKDGPRRSLQANAGARNNEVTIRTFAPPLSNHTRNDENFCEVTDGNNSTKIKFTILERPPRKSSSSYLENETMNTSSNRPSLIQQKRLQWEKEQAEMQGLWSPWGRPTTSAAVTKSQNNLNLSSNTNVGVVGQDALKEISTSCIRLTSSQGPSTYYLPPIVNGQRSESNIAKRCTSLSSPTQQTNQENHTREYLYPPKPRDNFKSNHSSETIYYANSKDHNYYINEFEQPVFNNARYYYEDENHTSGYQSETNYNGFDGSRQGSGDARQVNFQSNEDHRCMHEETKPLSRRQGNITQQGSTNAVLNMQHPAPAMRSSFMVGTGYADPMYIQKMQEKEKEKWLQDLKVQMEEQKLMKERETQNEERRSRWGDKGVAVGHFWEPSDLPNSRLPLPPSSSGSNQPPAWASRPHTTQSQPCLIDPNIYNANIGHQEQIVYMNQSTTDVRNMAALHSGLPKESTFLRGHNVPVDPEVAQEKEKKRLAALENQQAIMRQIEERNIKMMEERNQRFRQEMLDDQRIREQELRVLERAEMEKKLKLQLQQQNELFEEHNEVHERPREIIPSPRKRNQLYQQNSIDIVEYQQSRHLTNELIQTDEITSVTDGTNIDLKASFTPSPNLKCEFGTQTEIEVNNHNQLMNQQTVKSVKPHNAKEKKQSKIAIPASEGEVKKEKARWGVTKPKRPYIKQSERDPKYQERLKLRKLKEKPDQKFHVITADETDGRAEDRRCNSSYQKRNRLDNNQMGSQGHNKMSSKGNATQTKSRRKQQQREQQKISEPLHYRDFELPHEQIHQNSMDEELKKRQSSYSVYTEYERPGDCTNFNLVRVETSEPKGTRRILHNSNRKIGVISKQSNSESPSKGSSVGLHGKTTITPMSRTNEINHEEKKVSGRRQEGIIDSSFEDSYNEQQFTTSVSQRETHKELPKMSEPNPRKPKPIVTRASRATAQRAAPMVTRKNFNGAPENDDAAVAPRPHSPPVPALMRKMQEGVDPEEFGNIEKLSYEVPEQATIDSTPPALSVDIMRIPAIPVTTTVDLQGKIDRRSKSYNSTKSAVHMEKDLSHKRVLSPMEGKDSSKNEMSNFILTTAGALSQEPESRSLTQLHECSSDYYYMPPPILSPRSCSRENAITENSIIASDQEQLSALSSINDREISERKRLIGSLVNNDKIKEQISERESELSRNGIIEFSVHLPSMYNNPKGDLIVKYDDGNEEKIITCSQPSTICNSSPENESSEEQHEGKAWTPQNHAYEYEDPMLLERQQATISWLGANGHRLDSNTNPRRPYVLSHLSSLKRGIEQQQNEWDNLNMNSYRPVLNRNESHYYENHKGGRQTVNESLLYDYDY